MFQQLRSRRKLSATDSTAQSRLPIHPSSPPPAALADASAERPRQPRRRARIMISGGAFLLLAAVFVAVLDATRPVKPLLTPGWSRS